jgi:hypothetical protein
MMTTFANQIADFDEALDAGARPPASPWRERLDAAWTAVTDEVLSPGPSADFLRAEPPRIAPSCALAEARQVERAAAARRAELAELAARYASRLRAADRLHARARAVVVAAAQAEAARARRARQWARM